MRWISFRSIPSPTNQPKAYSTKINFFYYSRSSTFNGLLFETLNINYFCSNFFNYDVWCSYIVLYALYESFRRLGGHGGGAGGKEPTIDINYGGLGGSGLHSIPIKVHNRLDIEREKPISF